MSRIRWQDEVIELRRVVFRPDIPNAFRDPLRELARKLGVPVVAPDACPADGDVWVGCSPERGWGDADPHAIGWFIAIEVPAALHVLRAAADSRPLTGSSDEPRYVGH